MIASGFLEQIINKQLKRHQESQQEETNDIIQKYFNAIHQKQQSLLRSIYRQYQSIQVRKFLCGRQITKAYSCQNCQVEQSSIICIGCFDIQKHRKHKFRLIGSGLQKGSTCDCGDARYWSRDGFCQAHSHSPKKIKLPESKKTKFKQKTIYMFKILYVLYKSIEQIPKQDKQSRDNFIAQIDNFGQRILKAIISLIQNRFELKQLVSELLSSKIYIKDQEQDEIEQYIIVVDCLFSITKLSKTLTQCIKFFHLLLHQNPKVQELVAKTYIRQYPKIVMTVLSDLNFHILSNSLLMSGLSKRQQCKFVLFLKSSDLNEASAQSRVDYIYNAYCKYINDNVYLLNLNDVSAISYWRGFNKMGGFLQMCNYCEAFGDNQQEYSIVNQKYYSIEYIFFKNIFPILDKICNEGQKGEPQFFGIFIGKFFKKISIPRQKTKNNLLFTYQRLWAIGVYLFLLKDQDSYFEQDLNQQKCQKRFDKLYTYLNQSSRKQAIDKFLILFQRMLDYLLVSDPILLARQGPPPKGYQDFIKNYYGSGNLSYLFSIDAVFFKIVVKMLSHLDKKQPKPRQVLMRMNNLINKKVADLSKNVAINSIKHSSEAQKNRILENLDKLLTFSSQLSQCFYSQIPDLVIASRFSHIKSRKYYQDMFMKYYQNLLHSMGKREVKIDFFTKLVRCALFEQQDSFNRFIQQVISQNKQFLERQKLQDQFKPKTIDLRSHCNSLKQLLKANMIQQEYLNNDVLAVPNIKETNNFPYHLIQSKLFKVLITKLEYMLKQKVIGYYPSEHTPEGQKKKQPKPERISGFHLVKQTWKMSHYAKKDDFSLEISKLMRSMISSNPQQNKSITQNKNQQKYSQIFNLEFLPPILKKHIRYILQDSDLQNLLAKFQLGPVIELPPQQTQAQTKSQQHQILFSESIQNRFNQYSSVQSESLFQKIQQLKYSMNFTCNKCGIQDSHAQQLCFVSFSFVPPIFDIYEKFKVLYFNSCNHLYHQQCLESSFQANKINQCPQCKVKYNFLMPSQSQLMQINPQKSRQFAKKKFKQINSIVFSEEKEKYIYTTYFFVRIFKSIIIYLLMASTKIQGLYNDCNLQVYRTLIQMVITFCRVKKNIQIAKIKQRMFWMKTHEFRSLLQFLIDYLWHGVIKQDFFDSNCMKTVKLSHYQANILEKNIFFVTNKRPKLPYQNSEQLKHMQGFSLTLPDNLQQFLNLEGNCLCKTSKKRKIQLYCVIPHDGLDCQCESCCYLCQKRFIKKHLLQHKLSNEMILVSVDTGQLVYYARFQGKYWKYPIKNIYKDEFSRPIPTQISMTKAEILPKSAYKLDYEGYQDIFYNLYSKKYLTSSELKEINLSE